MPRKKLIKITPVIFLAFVFLTPSLKAVSLFDFQVIKKANNAYKNGDFKKSETLYKKLLKEKKVLLFELKTKLKTMQLTNTSELRAAKKDIARIQTAITAASAK